jgi:hypothetical protein
VEPPLAAAAAAEPDWSKSRPRCQDPARATHGDYYMTVIYDISHQPESFATSTWCTQAALFTGSMYILPLLKECGGTCTQASYAQTTLLPKNNVVTHIHSPHMYRPFQNNVETYWHDSSMPLRR